jgi:hypothetical protein
MALSALEKAVLMLTVLGGIGAIILIIGDHPRTTESSFSVTRDGSGLIQGIA